MFFFDHLNSQEIRINIFHFSKVEGFFLKTNQTSKTAVSSRKMKLILSRKQLCPDHRLYAFCTSKFPSNKWYPRENSAFFFCEFIVGTPGRVFDLLANGQGAFATKSLQILCLDEADELLSRGFKEAMYDIFQHMPGKSFFL
jgi:hypothetical protein